MLQAHETVVDCAHDTCGYQVFWDGQMPSASGIGPFPECRMPIPSPILLRLSWGTSYQILAMTAASRLYSPHIDGSPVFDLRTARAEVVMHPKDPGSIGLSNLSDLPWISQKPGGNAGTAKPSQGVELTNGLAVQFGKVRGEIER